MVKTLTAPKKATSDETIQEVMSCYGGEKWVKEVNELFPPTNFGCINFGYWEQVPELISIKLREKSQLDLYRKLFEFADIHRIQKATTLEVGCGRGHGVNLLSSYSHNSYGVDLVESQIQTCMNNYPSIKSNFKHAFSNKTGFQANFFDFVISVEAAQHFHNFFSFTREAYRILKNSGKIAITTFFFPNKRCKRAIKDILPQDISGTHRMISISQAEKFLKEAGFKNIKIVPIGAKVFKGFCKWANQAMSNKNHTPRWVAAYENKLIDYYMISGDKN